MTLQTSYARLLNKLGWGDGIYRPVANLKIGDIGYFRENTYYSPCNIFDISDQVLIELGRKLTDNNRSMKNDFRGSLVVLFKGTLKGTTE
jgi:hypothetical protein